MGTYTVKHYGVTMTLHGEDQNGCCGVYNLYNFGIKGDDSELTEEQVHKMYDNLMIKVRNQKDCNRTMLTASDVVPERMEDEAAAWYSPSYKRGKQCSLVDFCRYHGFQESEHAVNGNTGNGVAIFSLSLRGYTAKDWPCKKEIPMPAKPDFSDDETTLVSSDEVTTVLNKVREYLQSVEAA